ncbi:MAG: histidine--tRNA ligase [Rhodospirillales bacterium]|nr:MAG: histidine--tRNA ligase [Rhodospirillales bacterium]
MASLQPVRGTRDLLPDDCRRHRRIEQAAFAVAERYGYGEIATPAFEFTEVFARSLGDTSDIVAKEMYTFQDRGGASLTLRPENTAGVVRAVVSNGLLHQVPLKLFYRGPMFRYERPQKGRLRQFHQVGVELIGVADALADVEVVTLGADFLAALGLADKVVLEINTLGDSASRAVYRERLITYFAAHHDSLSPDSRDRLHRNPLRILDSKDEGDRALIAEAPLITDSLSDGSRAFFEAVLAGLEACGVPFRHNPRLVRGLDYYCHTAFEFTTDALGAQNAVLAGGRYDGLVAELGGPTTPGIGWAAGVERLAMLVAEDSGPPAPIAVVPVDMAQQKPALAVAQRLRSAGLVVDLGYSGGLAKRMKRANRIGARAAVILGEAELAAGLATVRDMHSGEQQQVPIDSLPTHLARLP